MSFKELITRSYGEETYNTIAKLQQLKVRSAVAKNQWIFLQRCIHHNIPPMSLRSRPTINTQQGSTGVTIAVSVTCVLNNSAREQNFFGIKKKLIKIWYLSFSIIIAS